MVSLDVHPVNDSGGRSRRSGRSVIESILETEAKAIRDLLRGLSGRVQITFEEGTQSYAPRLGRKSTPYSPWIPTEAMVGWLRQFLSRIGHQATQDLSYVTDHIWPRRRSRRDVGK
jgi:hypothetical protein